MVTITQMHNSGAVVQCLQTKLNIHASTLSEVHAQLSLRMRPYRLQQVESI